MSANLKIIHLVCACLFLGNIIVSGIWAVLAERTRNHTVVQFSNRVVLITDLIFTFFGSIGVVWTGFGLSQNFGGYQGHLWIQWSYGLLALSGLIWLFVLVPIQLKRCNWVANHSRDRAGKRLTMMRSPTMGAASALRAKMRNLIGHSTTPVAMVKPT